MLSEEPLRTVARLVNVVTESGLTAGREEPWGPVQKRQIQRLDGDFDLIQIGRLLAISFACSPKGRGQMARRRTKRDAIKQFDCRFAVLHLSVMTKRIDAPEAELGRAPILKPFASHSANKGNPASRIPLAGGRARGVHYDDQENAGGRHPPGRNKDCRYRR